MLNFVQQGSGGFVFGATFNVVFTAPPTSDNLLLVIPAASGSGQVAAPSGWSTIVETNNSGVINIGAYYKWAGGSETGTYTFTPSGAFEQGGWTWYEISGGVGSGAPTEGTPLANTGFTATARALSVTSTTDNGLHFVGYNPHQTISGFSGPAGYTMTTVPTGGGPSEYMGYKTISPAGATGDEDITQGADFWATVSFVIKPGSTSPPLSTTPRLNATWFHFWGGRK